MKFLKYIDRGLIFLLGIFSLSLPISKAGINASAGLFIFLSLFKFLFNIEEMKQIYKKTLRYTTLQNNITAYIVSTILKVAHNHANIKPASIGDTVTLCRKLNL